MTPSLINEHEASKRLGIRPSTLRRWRWSGTGPDFLKIGGAVRYTEAGIDAFLNAAVRISTQQGEGR